MRVDSADQQNSICLSARRGSDLLYIVHPLPPMRTCDIMDGMRTFGVRRCIRVLVFSRCGPIA